MWKRPRIFRRTSELEATLRARRPEAGEEFVKSLSVRVDGDRPRQPVAWSRLAFAGAVSTLILGSFASFGGLGYASSGATSTYKLAKELVVQQNITVNRSSASAQYPPPPKQPTQQSQGVAGQQAASGTLGATQALPFTGISLITTTLIGSVLLGLGLFLRRRERRDS
jgi:LPXTG-motif cell wall-anchored protein